MAGDIGHVMLSYQWDSQDLVEKVYNALRSHGIKAWMDIKGGMKGNINDSMAEGVDNAGVVCCFMSTKYMMESKNCKKELNYADSQNVSIVPIMCEKGFKAKGWLGVLTAGLLWIDFRETAQFDNSVESLAKEVVYASESDISLPPSEQQAAAGVKPAKHVDVKKKPGRAFRHKLVGKFLAESGQVKVHTASGSRSSLVLRDKAEDTSYWVEERQKGGDGIVFYRNYATNGYLGYDPNGDYLYTKKEHYGAEEWKLMADDHSSNGERAVVLFANYGKKYLAIRNGTLTGVNSYSDDCVWIL